MGIVKTKGIIISENNTGDFDKMLTMITPDLGKISCAARGARRPKSSLIAGTQLLAFGEYILYKGANAYNINSCELIEIFYNIRTDLDKLSVAAYITKIINDVTTENQNSYQILQLFLNTLYTISETDKNLDIVLSIFRFRLLKIIGFSPKVTECVNCNTKENLRYFSIKDNGYKCNICGKQDKSAIEMSEATKTAIQYAILAEPKKLYSFIVNQDSVRELSLISKIYLEEKLEKNY